MCGNRPKCQAEYRLETSNGNTSASNLQRLDHVSPEKMMSFSGEDEATTATS
ncbi:hypothetical protein AAMO2058_000679400 [Amorphochlora amoebiformis]